MTDEDFDALENPRTNRARRAMLEKEYKACIVSIKTIDKPNVHRLHELVSTTLPMENMCPVLVSL